MAEDLKRRVHDFWQANPCGAKFTDAEVGSREFFDAVERYRYATESHIPDVVRFDRWKDRDVLEIGCGLGTDGINFARQGANYTGIDLTERAIELVRTRFGYEGFEAQLRVADAENLPFEDEMFDLVYSHGVLHHTPNIERAVAEVHRVLRPGATAMVMLYHKNSYNYYVNIMTFRRLGAMTLRFDWGPRFVHALTGEGEERLRELQARYRSDRVRFLDRQEFLNQNTDGAGNPLARAFTRREGADLFAPFSRVETEVHFLNRRWVPVLGRLMPKALERKLGARIGWHLWVIARK
jgi:ubiquinone/menaquinone biosynthesis C-methylase UbiE